MPVVLEVASVYGLMGESELAHASYDSALALLQNEVKALPDDHRIHSALGIAYAGLGRRDEAIHEGKRGVELFPLSKDAFGGVAPLEDLALIYAMVGDHEAALDGIEHLLSIPSQMSAPLLRIDPRWDSLRDHPRFQGLLEKYAID